MSNQMLLEWVQQMVGQGRYHVTAHALEYHPFAEGFTVPHAVDAILAGTIIQHIEPECRCTICGEARGIEIDDRFHGRWIHSVVAYDRMTEMVIITMYRPLVSEWDTPQTRRRRPDSERRPLC